LGTGVIIISAFIPVLSIILAPKVTEAIPFRGPLVEAGFVILPSRII
jgi:hypothetical protein